MTMVTTGLNHGIFERSLIILENEHARKEEKIVACTELEGYLNQVTNKKIDVETLPVRRHWEKLVKVLLRNLGLNAPVLNLLKLAVEMIPKTLGLGLQLASDCYTILLKTDDLRTLVELFRCLSKFDDAQFTDAVSVSVSVAVSYSNHKEIMGGCMSTSTSNSSSLNGFKNKAEMELWTSYLKLEALRFAARLMRCCGGLLKTQIMEDIEFWYDVFFRCLFGSYDQQDDSLLMSECATDTRNAALDALKALMGVIPVEEQIEKCNRDKMKEAIYTKYADKIVSLVGTPGWYELWYIVLDALGTEIMHRNTNQLINRLLNVEEKAFKYDRTIVRAEAFMCWRYLVDKFLPPGVEGDSDLMQRAIRLLIQPMLPNNARSDFMSRQKLNAWWLLIHRMLPGVEQFGKMTVVPFLHFCYGHPKPKDVPPGKKFTALHIPCARALACLLDPDPHNNKIPDGPSVDVDVEECVIEPFRTPFLKTPEIFLQMSEELIHSVRECTAILSTRSETETCIALQHTIWRHLMTHVSNALNMPKITSEQVSKLVKDLLRVVQNLTERSEMSAPALAERCIDLVIESLVIGPHALPTRILTSPVYYVGSARLMTGTPALFLLEMMVSQPLLKLCTSQPRYIPVLNAILKVGMAHKNVLEFMQSAMKQLENIGSSRNNRDSSAEKLLLCLVWSKVAAVVTEYVKQHQNVNQGDSKQHDLSCLYLVLLFPFFHLYSLSYKQTMELVNVWRELYKTFMNVALQSVNTLDVNEICEAVACKISQALNKHSPKSANQALPLLQAIQCLVKTVRFTDICRLAARNKTKFHLLPERGRTSKPTHYITHIMKLLVKVSQMFVGFVSTGEWYNTVGSLLMNSFEIVLKNMNAANVAAAVPVVSGLSDAILAMVQAKPVQDGTTKFWCESLHRMWRAYFGFIETYLHQKSVKDFMGWISPLLDAGFKHYDDDVKAITVEFWDKNVVPAFVEDKTIVPQALKEARKKCIVKKKEAPSMPTIDSDNPEPVEKFDSPPKKPQLSLVQQLREGGHILTRHQKEVLRRRKDDIPALYNSTLQPPPDLEDSESSQDTSDFLPPQRIIETPKTVPTKPFEFKEPFPPKFKVLEPPSCVRRATDYRKKMMIDSEGSIFFEDSESNKSEDVTMLKTKPEVTTETQIIAKSIPESKPVQKNTVILEKQIVAKSTPASETKKEITTSPEKHILMKSSPRNKHMEEITATSEVQILANSKSGSEPMKEIKVTPEKQTKVKSTSRNEPMKKITKTPEKQILVKSSPESKSTKEITATPEKQILVKNSPESEPLKEIKATSENQVLVKSIPGNKAMKEIIVDPEKHFLINSTSGGEPLKEITATPKKQDVLKSSPGNEPVQGITVTPEKQILLKSSSGNKPMKDVTMTPEMQVLLKTISESEPLKEITATPEKQVIEESTPENKPMEEITMIPEKQILTQNSPGSNAIKETTAAFENQNVEKTALGRESPKKITSPLKEVMAKGTLVNEPAKEIASISAKQIVMESGPGSESMQEPIPVTEQNAVVSISESMPLCVVPQEITPFVTQQNFPEESTHRPLSVPVTIFSQDDTPVSLAFCTEPVSPADPSKLNLDCVAKPLVTQTTPDPVNTIQTTLSSVSTPLVLTSSVETPISFPLDPAVNETSIFDMPITILSDTSNVTVLPKSSGISGIIPGARAWQPNNKLNPLQKLDYASRLPMKKPPTANSITNYLKPFKPISITLTADENEVNHTKTGGSRTIHLSFEKTDDSVTTTTPLPQLEQPVEPLIPVQDVISPVMDPGSLPATIIETGDILEASSMSSVEVSTTTMENMENMEGDVKVVVEKVEDYGLAKTYAALETMVPTFNTTQTEVSSSSRRKTRSPLRRRPGDPKLPPFKQLVKNSEQDAKSNHKRQKEKKHRLSSHSRKSLSPDDATSMNASGDTLSPSLLPNKARKKVKARKSRKSKLSDIAEDLKAIQEGSLTFAPLQVQPVNKKKSSRPGNKEEQKYYNEIDSVEEATGSRHGANLMQENKSKSSNKVSDTKKADSDSVTSSTETEVISGKRKRTKRKMDKDFVNIEDFFLKERKRKLNDPSAEVPTSTTMEVTDDTVDDIEKEIKEYTESCSKLFDESYKEILKGVPPEPEPVPPGTPQQDATDKEKDELEEMISRKKPRHSVVGSKSNSSNSSRKLRSSIKPDESIPAAETQLPDAVVEMPTTADISKSEEVSNVSLPDAVMDVPVKPKTKAMKNHSKRTTSLSKQKSTKKNQTENPACVKETPVSELAKETSGKGNKRTTRNSKTPKRIVKTKKQDDINSKDSTTSPEESAEEIPETSGKSLKGKKTKSRESDNPKETRRKMSAIAKHFISSFQTSDFMQEAVRKMQMMKGNTTQKQIFQKVLEMTPRISHTPNLDLSLSEAVKENPVKTNIKKDEPEVVVKTVLKENIPPSSLPEPKPPEEVPSCSTPEPMDDSQYSDDSEDIIESSQESNASSIVRRPFPALCSVSVARLDSLLEPGTKIDMSQGDEKLTVVVPQNLRSPYKVKQGDVPTPDQSKLLSKSRYIPKPKSKQTVYIPKPKSKQTVMRSEENEMSITEVDVHEEVSADQTPNIVGVSSGSSSSKNIEVKENAINSLVNDKSEIGESKPLEPKEASSEVPAGEVGLITINGNKRTKTRTKPDLANRSSSEGGTVDTEENQPMIPEVNMNMLKKHTSEVQSSEDGTVRREEKLKSKLNIAKKLLKECTSDLQSSDGNSDMSGEIAQAKLKSKLNTAKKLVKESSEGGAATKEENSPVKLNPKLNMAKKLMKESNSEVESSKDTVMTEETSPVKLKSKLNMSNQLLKECSLEVQASVVNVMTEDNSPVKLKSTLNIAKKLLNESSSDVQSSEGSTIVTEENLPVKLKSKVNITKKLLKDCSSDVQSSEDNNVVTEENSPVKLRSKLNIAKKRKESNSDVPSSEGSNVVTDKNSSVKLKSKLNIAKKLKESSSDVQSSEGSNIVPEENLPVKIKSKPNIEKKLKESSSDVQSSEDSNVVTEENPVKLKSKLNIAKKLKESSSDVQSSEDINVVTEKNSPKKLKSKLNIAKKLLKESSSDVESNESSSAVTEKKSPVKLKSKLNIAKKPKESSSDVQSSEDSNEETEENSPAKLKSKLNITKKLLKEPSSDVESSESSSAVTETNSPAKLKSKLNIAKKLLKESSLEIQSSEDRTIVTEENSPVTLKSKLKVAKKLMMESTSREVGVESQTAENEIPQMNVNISVDEELEDNIIKKVVSEIMKRSENAERYIPRDANAGCSPAKQKPPSDSDQTPSPSPPKLLTSSPSSLLRAFSSSPSLRVDSGRRSHHKRMGGRAQYMVGLAVGANQSPVSSQVTEDDVNSPSSSPHSRKRLLYTLSEEGDFTSSLQDDEAPPAATPSTAKPDLPLKRALKHTGSDSPCTPPAKKKRVWFPDPEVSATKVFTADENMEEESSPTKHPMRARMLLGLTKRDRKLKRARLRTSSSPSTPSPNSTPDLSGLVSQGSMEELCPERLLNSQDAFFPPLVSCMHPIESIAHHLTTHVMWTKALAVELNRKNVSTVGDLARLDEASITRLPVALPKIARTRKVLEEYYRNLEAGSTVKDTSEEPSPAMTTADIVRHINANKGSLSTILKELTKTDTCQQEVTDALGIESVQDVVDRFGANSILEHIVRTNPDVVSGFLQSQGVEQVISLLPQEDVVKYMLDHKSQILCKDADLFKKLYMGVQNHSFLNSMQSFLMLKRSTEGILKKLPLDSVMEYAMSQIQLQDKMQMCAESLLANTDAKFDLSCAEKLVVAIAKRISSTDFATINFKVMLEYLEKNKQ